MNKSAFFLPLALLVTTLPATAQAQAARNRVAFVNVPQLVAAVPGNSNYLTISKAADADLGKRQQSLQSLIAKAQSQPTAANRNAAIKAQQDFVAAQKSYQTKLASAFKPLAGKINSTIASVARSNGFSVVLDSQVAARSKLVVYAAPTTDLTQAVLKALKK